MGGVTADIFQLGYAPENKLPIGKWAFEFIRLRDSLFEDNRFIIEETPWLIEVLETLLNGNIQEVVLMCCAQGGKTVSMLVALAWALVNRSGNTMFVAQTLDEAKDTAKEKIIPIVESCPPLAAQLPVGNKKHLRSNRHIQFPNSTLRIGPANEAFLRGKTIASAFADECSMYKPGKMEQIRARTTRIWNRKIFFASTPLDARTDFEKAFLDGTQQRYHLPTPCCGTMVYLTSQNLEKLFVWDKKAAEEAMVRVEPPAAGQEENEEESPWDILKDSVRLVCPKCGAQHAQTKDLYRKMIKGARYLRGNRKASKEKASFAFNVFCLSPDVMGWGKVIELWLKAKQEELKGNLAPLKEFITLRLAETWDERLFLSYTIPNFTEYDPGEEWGMFRSMTIDCQEHLAEFWYVVRAWAKDGSSRLLDFGKVHTEAELKERQQFWNVKPHLVGMDAAYQRYQVFEICTRNGWTAMVGEDRNEWLHALDDKGRKIARPFSPPGRGDPRSGKSYANRHFCWVINWSNPVIKDLLANLKNGKGASWAVCDMGPEKTEIYAKGIDSERKKEKWDRFGRPVLRWERIRANHPWDAECMQVVFAAMAKLFIFGIEEPAKEEMKAAA